METKLRVALVDDHTVVREGFKALLNASGKFEVVSEEMRKWHSNLLINIQLMYSFQISLCQQ